MFYQETASFGIWTHDLHQQLVGSNPTEINFYGYCITVTRYWPVLSRQLFKDKYWFAKSFYAFKKDCWIINSTELNAIYHSA